MNVAVYCSYSLHMSELWKYWNSSSFSVIDTGSSMVMVPMVKGGSYVFVKS